MNIRRSCFLDLYSVIQMDRLHDHTHFMITIFPFSQNIQSKIDLGKCF